MRRLCLLLGMPQNRFASIHVVGTNGKTSVTRMTAALLEAHGVSTGAYVSPHITSWRERVLIRGEPISEEAFTQALERAEQSAQVADRSAGDEGPVTQFELLTAAAFVAFAAARVQFAVIEAGLGGRLDATNVIPSQLTVLTSVGYDHTEWLGETLEEIAGEKVAVLRDHTKLIRPPMPEPVERVIKEAAEARHAEDLELKIETPSGHVSFESWNFFLALSVVDSLLGGIDGDAAERIRQTIRIPGRADVEPGRSTGDLRRRPQPRRGTRARGGAYRPRRRPRGRLLSSHPRGQGRAGNRQRAGAGRVEVRLHRDPTGADRGIGPPGRTLAAGARGGGTLPEGGRGGRGDRGSAGGVGAGTRTCQGAWGGRACGWQPLPSVVDMDREARSELLTMMGLVAVVVAVVILVFFAFGYVFGLLFL